MQVQDIPSDNLSISKESDTNIHFSDLITNCKNYEIFPIPKPIFS